MNHKWPSLVSSSTASLESRMYGIVNRNGYSISFFFLDFAIFIPLSSLTPVRVDRGSATERDSARRIAKKCIRIHVYISAA